MTPAELAKAAAEIAVSWPNALVYPNNGRNPEIPDNALAVDADQVWVHDCDHTIDCNECAGWYKLVAWIDCIGEVHYVDVLIQGKRGYELLR